MSSPTTGHADRLNAFFSVLSEELADVDSKRDEIRFARDRQLSRMRKRAGITNPALRPAAISSFLATNAVVGDTSVNLDRELVADARHFITVVLERLTTRFDASNIQVSLDHRLLYELWRFGPGAANGITGTHAADKIQQVMTCTDSCVPLVLRLRRTNPYFAMYDHQNKVSGYTEVRGSRLTTVPKNEETERTIAIEPSGNMALQLAAGRYLEMALESIGLDITCQQPKNKLMAMRGSMDGSVATIDLKSASDMISLDLVRLLLPPDWMRLIEAIRSPEINVPGHGWVRLNMVSTMGNGFTFPLMTLILVSLIYALRARRGGPTLFVSWKDTCVFGDDIIVPTCEYEELCDTLTAAGLVVNRDKSYWEGPFRESCGGDYWNGYDVTPFYGRRLNNDRAVFTVINQVLEWGARHGILLHRTLTYLKGCLRGKVHFVPEWHNPDEGVLVSGVARRYTYLKTIVPRSRLSNDNHYAMMLVCGGYIESDGPDLYYSPRPFKTQAKVRTARLPSGFLDGSDPLKRSERITSFIESYAHFVLG
jgi:hypothetical protein